jgi:hypothetical protein
MSTRSLINLLVRLFPRAWRVEYGAELREMLGSQRLTLSAIVDVVRTGVGLRLAGHNVAWRLIFAAATSTAVELFAVHRHLTDNILWLPDTPARAATLALLCSGWAPATIAVGKNVHRRLTRVRRQSGSVSVRDS